MLGLWLSLSVQDPAALVDRLREESIDAREAAVHQLSRIGFPAARALELAVADPDPEVSSRASLLLRSVPSLASAPGETLASLPPGAELVRAALAPGGRSAALLVRRGDRRSVVHGPREGPAFEAVDGLTLSPDGLRAAYVGFSGATGSVLADEELLYEGPGRPSSAVHWSPDSRRVACEIREDGRSFLLLGQDRGRPFDSVNEVLFSPDGRQIAYRAREDGREVVVRDGKPGPAFWRMDSPVFSKLGVLAYAAGPFLDPTLVVGDEVRRLDGEYAQQLVFSPDGRRLAYLLYTGGEALLVVGEERRAVLGTVVGTPLFSPDGSEIAYVAVRGADWIVVRGEAGGPRFERIEWTSLRWSPDGLRLAFAATRAGRAVVVAGGEAGPEFDRVGAPEWSPDGRRVAYAAWTAAGACVVVSGRRTEAFREVSAPAWSADGRRVTFAALEEGGAFFKTIELR